MTTDFREQRLQMVAKQVVARGIADPAVVSAMRTVPRHEFVPNDLREFAYDDRPLPIGRGQTISQPYIVALMTELLELRGEERVLEVGTGSGYQAAVLAEIAARVYTIEILEPLLRDAAATLARLCYPNVVARFGDGRAGWPEMAPFDAIVVTAAPARRIPEDLLGQIKDGGRLVVPVGGEVQTLRLVRRRGKTFEQRDVTAVRFVPLVGAAE